MMLYYVVFIVFSSLKCFVCEIKKLQVSGHLANQMDLVYRITARCMPVVSLIFEHIKCLGLCVCYSEEIMFLFSKIIQIQFESGCMVSSPSHGLRHILCFSYRKTMAREFCIYLTHYVCLITSVWPYGTVGNTAISFLKELHRICLIEKNCTEYFRLICTYIYLWSTWRIYIFSSI